MSPSAAIAWTSPEPSRSSTRTTRNTAVSCDDTDQRYVEVTGLKVEPRLDTITGVVVASDTPAALTFETSSPAIDQLQRNIVWSQRGSFLSVPATDPARDERLGSLLDAQSFAPTACFNADAQTFFQKWVADIRAAQRSRPAFPATAPRLNDGDGSPAAAAAGILVPWTMYECYADRWLIESHLSAMVRWVDYVRALNPDLLFTKGVGAGGGDLHERGAATDETVIATAFFAHAVDLVSSACRVVGHEQEAQRYGALAAQIREAGVRPVSASERQTVVEVESGAYELAMPMRAGLAGR